MTTPDPQPPTLSYSGPSKEPPPYKPLPWWRKQHHGFTLPFFGLVLLVLGIAVKSTPMGILGGILTVGGVALAIRRALRPKASPQLPISVCGIDTIYPFESPNEDENREATKVLEANKTSKDRISAHVGGLAAAVILFLIVFAISRTSSSTGPATRGAAASRHAGEWWGDIATFVFFGALIFFIVWPLSWAAHLRRRRRPVLGWTVDGIAEGDDQRIVVTKWAGFVDLMELNLSFVLRHRESDGIGLVIPKRCFAGEEDKRLFIDAVTRHIPQWGRRDF